MLVSLVVVKLTGANWMDPVVGLLVAAAITRTGVRILIEASRRLADEALPADELAALQQVVGSFVGDEVVGYHDLRARHVGSNHQVDLHLQFASGTSLERAHYVSHQLQDAIVERLARHHRARAPRARGPRAARPLRAARQRVLGPLAHRRPGEGLPWPDVCTWQMRVPSRPSDPGRGLLRRSRRGARIGRAGDLARGLSLDRQGRAPRRRR